LSTITAWPRTSEPDEPASYFTFFAGGLGWGISGGLGMKLARPEKTIIVTWRRAYMFTNPTACHFVSEAYDLHCLRSSATTPSGTHQSGDNRSCRTDGRSVPIAFLYRVIAVAALRKIVEAHGGYGEMVDDPQELPAALGRALKVVKEEKRQAVLNVICGTH
jgi:acetolactate synthase-1/2/3 large subunit